jgi:hypothetical protein
VELQRKGIVRIFGPASNKSAEYGLHFCKGRLVLLLAAAAEEEEAQNLRVVLSRTGAPAIHNC